MINFLEMSRSAKPDFTIILRLLSEGIPFTFIRFSDGEMEVIFNSKLVIQEGSVEWRGNKNTANYPVFDSKSFLPERDVDFRRDLVEAASFRAPNFFKGIRTRGAFGSRDKKKMIELNSELLDGLTFSDLLINENWRLFIDKAMPLIIERGNVTYFGNFRARPDFLGVNIRHVKIGDDFIPRYAAVLEESMAELTALPLGETILSSASSLSNILGHRLFTVRPDMTFIDVGTALNPFIGLEEGLREYHSQLLPWTPKNFRKKTLYYLLGSHRMKW